METLSEAAAHARLLKHEREWSGLTDADLIEEMIWARGRESFTEFRKLVRPDMVRGWWIEEVEGELQGFYEALVRGERPKLALMAPPQHGKSWAVTDFIAWVAGKSPELKSIFASYGDDLGMRTNLDVQRLMATPAYQKIFSQLRVGVQGWQCNTSLIEFPHHAGSFRNTTVNSAINGLGLHLGLIDDPVKGRREANSKPTRDMTWNWYTDDFFGRFDKSAGQLIIMTRWHVDDLLGRALLKMDGWRVLRYPAVAALNKDGSKNWTDRRSQGEALFPEWKPIDFLMERKALLTEAGWESLYQQNPYVVGGGVLPIEKLRVLPQFDRDQVLRSVRYFDKAGTDAQENPGSAFTAGCLMHAMQDGRFVIEHIRSGQWSALDREVQIKATGDADAATYDPYELWVEQEPGSGGKESAENTIRNNAGKLVYADKVTGDKETRAEPFVAQVQGGNVWLVAGDWVLPFLDEAENWPAAKRKDKIDAAAGAFAKLVTGTMYDTSYSWL